MSGHNYRTTNEKVTASQSWRNFEKSMDSADLVASQILDPKTCSNIFQKKINNLCWLNRETGWTICNNIWNLCTSEHSWCPKKRISYFWKYFSVFSWIFGRGSAQIPAISRKWLEFEPTPDRKFMKKLKNTSKNKKSFFLGIRNTLKYIDFKYCYKWFSQFLYLINTNCWIFWNMSVEHKIMDLMDIGDRDTENPWIFRNFINFGRL